MHSGGKIIYVGEKMSSPKSSESQSMETRQPFNSLNEKTIISCCHNDGTFSREYMPFGGIQNETKNLILCSWSPLKRRKFKNIFVLLFFICRIIHRVECTGVLETDRVNIRPGESGTESHFMQVIVYPKCTDDSHCTGEQVCHYPLTGKQLISGYHLNDRTLVSIPLGLVLNAKLKAPN